MNLTRAKKRFDSLQTGKFMESEQYGEQRVSNHDVSIPLQRESSSKFKNQDGQVMVSGFRFPSNGKVHGKTGNLNPNAERDMFRFPSNGKA